MQTRILVSDALEAQRNAAVVEELEQTRQRIRRFAERELALRRERLERAEAKETQELDLKRRYDQDRTAVRDQMAHEASGSFHLDRRDIRKKTGETRFLPSVVARSAPDSHALEAGTLEMNVEPVPASTAHPYRAFFNWPALREDRITGKAD